MIKELLYQESISLMNVPQNKRSKLTELKEEISSFTIICDLNISLSHQSLAQKTYRNQ